MSSRFDLRESDNVLNEFRHFKQETLGVLEAESDKSKERNCENQGAQTSGAETISGGGGERRCLLQHRLPPLITSVPVMEIRRTCDAIIAKNESRGYPNVSFLRVDQSELQNAKPTLNGISSSKVDTKSNNGNKTTHDASSKSGEKENVSTPQPAANSSNQLGIPALQNSYCSQNLKGYGLNGDRVLANTSAGQPFMFRDPGVESAVNPSNQVSNPYAHCSNTDMLMSSVNSATGLPVPCSTCQSAGFINNDKTIARPQDIQQSQCKDLVPPTTNDCCCHSRYSCFNKAGDDKCQCWRNQFGYSSAYHGFKHLEQTSEEDCCCNKRHSCRSRCKCENKSIPEVRDECCCSQGDHQNFRNWRRNDLACWAYPSYSSQCCSKKNSTCCDCDSYSLGPTSSNSLCLTPYDPRQANKEMTPSLPNFNTFVNDYPIQDLLEALRMNQMALTIGMRPPMDDLPDDYKCCCDKESRFCDNSSERTVWIPEDEPASRFSRTSMRSRRSMRMANYDISSDENDAYPSDTKIFPFPSQSRMSSRHKVHRPLKKIVVDWGDKNQYNFCHDMDRESLTDNHCNCGISNMIKAKRKIASRCSMKNYDNYR